LKSAYFLKKVFTATPNSILGVAFVAVDGKPEGVVREFAAMLPV
jgi:hypothetical protein